MAGNALFRRVNKAKADFVSGQRSGRSQSKRSSVKERVEFAGLGIELLQAGLAPGEVIGFFLSSTQQFVPSRIRACGECLTLVEGLRADFSRVVHAHQSRSVFPLAGAQARFFVSDGGGRSRSRFGAGYRMAGQLPQALINLTQEPIDSGKRWAA